MKTAVIAYTDDGRYVVKPQDTGKIEIVPASVFHLCLYPKEISDEVTGRIKLNTILETVRVENGFIYPNHHIYSPMGDKLQLPREESREIEFKSSFIHSASSNGLRSEQLYGIAATLAGFSNSRIHGTLYVGIKGGGRVTDNVENEVGGDPTEFEAAYRNQLAQALSSKTFAAKHLSFYWEKAFGRLYCRIEVSPFSTILFVKGNWLFIRSDAAATISLHDSEIVSFVRSWQP